MTLLQSRQGSVARQRPMRRLRGLSRSLVPLTWPVGIAVGALVLGAGAASPTSLRLSLAVSGLALAVGVAASAGPGLLYLMVVWTAVLGLVRRLLSNATVANQTDPLLLIAVGGLVLLAAAAAERGAFRDLTRLASAVLLFNVFTLLEAFNPNQGSLTAGITGLVFLLVPALAFWIGRGLCTESVITVVGRLIAGLSVLAAIYGLLQTFVAFPPWDSRWIQNSGYAALNVDKVIRAFGSFASGQEYGLYLGVGIVVWVAYGFAPRRALWTAGVCTLLFVALFYESSRTPLVTTVFAVGIVLAATRLRNPVVAVVIGVGFVALLPVLVGHFTSSNPVNPTPGTGALAAHQIGGLAHPFSSQTSTLSGHFSEFTHGFDVMFHHPLGLGVSVINIAGAKLGSAANTEYDPSNVAIALGVPGLLAYVVILVEGFRLALRRTRQRRDFVARVALGIIAVTLFQWTNGGLYSVAFLPWLMMGWLDRDAGLANEIPLRRSDTERGPETIARAAGPLAIGGQR